MIFGNVLAPGFQTAVAVAVERNTNQGVAPQDVSVIVVDSPLTDRTGTADESEIRQAIATVDDVIRFSTAEVRGFGAVVVGKMSMEPMGRVVDEGEVVQCYNDEQLDLVYNHLLSNKIKDPANKKTQHMVMLEDNLACSTIEYSAIATHIGTAPVSVYNMTTFSKEMLPQILEHEVGHNLGLGHAPQITCGKNGLEFFDKSIQRQLAGGCTTEKNDDGTTYVYASPQTVMGNAWKEPPLYPVSPYSPVEMNTLNPEFKIQTIEPVPGTYRLAVEPGKTIGVRLKLPENHVLNTVVKDANSVILALDDVYEWSEAAEAGETINVSDQRIRHDVGVYVTSSKSNDITTIDTVPYPYRNLGSIAEFAAVARAQELAWYMLRPFYIDDALNVALTFGMDNEGYLVKVTELVPTADAAIDTALAVPK